MKRPIAALVLGLAAFLAHGGGPVAFIADVQGGATVEGNGQVRFLSELAPGTKLLLATGSAVTVTFVASGTEYTARGPGEFRVTESALQADKGDAPQRRAVAKLGDPAVLASTAKLATASLRMRGLKSEEPGTVKLASPVDTRVATLHPVLRWRGDVPAGEVQLVDAAGKPVWKGPAAAGTATPAIRLKPASAYTWTVRNAQGVAVEAKFETLDRDALARVERSRKQARSFPDHVLHALLLQELGATQEAREAWGRLARDRPDLPELANLAP